MERKKNNNNKKRNVAGYPQGQNGVTRSMEYNTAMTEESNDDVYCVMS